MDTATRLGHDASVHASINGKPVTVAAAGDHPALRPPAQLPYPDAVRDWTTWTTRPALAASALVESAARAGNKR